jgi:hypothetical protein
VTLGEVMGQSRSSGDVRFMSASLIGHSGSSAFRLSAATVSMSLTGSCFSSESASREGHCSTAQWKARVSFHWMCRRAFMLLPRLVPGSSGTLCRQPRCSA